MDCASVEEQTCSLVMRQTLLFIIIMIVLGGCATQPSIDETSRQHLKDKQRIKQSDAFARSLAD